MGEFEHHWHRTPSVPALRVPKRIDPLPEPIEGGGFDSGFVKAHCFAKASCISLSVLPSFVFQATRPLAEPPCTTAAAVEGDEKM